MHEQINDPSYTECNFCDLCRNLSSSIGCDLDIIGQNEKLKFG